MGAGVFDLPLTKWAATSFRRVVRSCRHVSPRRWAVTPTRWSRALKFGGRRDQPAFLTRYRSEVVEKPVNTRSAKEKARRRSDSYVEHFFRARRSSHGLIHRRSRYLVRNTGFGPPNFGSIQEMRVKERQTLDSRLRGNDIKIKPHGFSD